MNAQTQFTSGIAALFAACIVAFGLTWPVSKAVLADATPIWAATARGGLAALVLLVLVLARGQLRWPGRRDWPIVISIGLFQMTAFFALTQLGLQYVGAGRAAILAYTTILWVVPLSLVVLRERIDIAKIAGVCLGLAGVATLLGQFSFRLNDPGILRGGVFLLGASLSWALAIIHARGHRWQATPLQLLPWQFATATLGLLVLALIFEPDGFIGSSPRNWGLIAILGALLSPFGSWSSIVVTRALPAIVTSLGFLAAPVVGLTVSALWLGEAVTADLLLGGVLIFAGLALISLAGWRRQRLGPSQAAPRSP